MIESGKQRAVTLDRLAKFRTALEHARCNPDPEVDPIISKAHVDGLASVLETLERELAEYDLSRGRS